MSVGVSERRARRWTHETVIRWFLFVCALVSVLTTVGIVAVLATEAARFFAEVPLNEFLTGRKWTPTFRDQHFGVLPLVCGTFLVSAGALLVSVPIGLGTAIYLSEYAGPRLRDVVKPVLEILAGIPSVVYGYLGLVLVSPLVRWMFPSANVFNAASAAIVVGIMVLPMIVSLSEDVLRSVPRSLREAAYALGATKVDVTVRVVVPAALSGVMASILLALGRAIGETMAVTLIAGAKPVLTLNPLSEIQTMTAFIVEVTKGDARQGTAAYNSIFAVALALLVITMIINLLAQAVLARMRERYE